jgi:hypothetical protein
MKYPCVPATNLTSQQRAPPNMVSPVASAAVNEASTSLPPMHANTNRRTKHNNILGPLEMGDQNKGQRTSIWSEISVQIIKKKWR